MRSSARTERGGERRLAIRAEVWYLVNLLALPGIGFLAQLYLLRRHRARADGPGLQHLRRATWTSVAAGAGVLGSIGIAWWLFGTSPAGWTGMILAGVCVHTAFVLLGLLRLAQALNLR